MIRKKDLPPSFSLIEQGKNFIVLKDNLKDTLLKMGIANPEFFLKGPRETSGRYQGRGELKTIALPGEGNEQIVIRHFRRGGKVQKFSSDLYFGASRPLKELWIGYLAMGKEIPTAEILAACHSKVFWRFYRGDLVSREIKEGIDLPTYLKGLPWPLSKEKIFEKRRVIEIVGNLIHKMHDAGIFHGDLNLKNIILQVNNLQTIKGYIIDFDKSLIRSELSDTLRIRNLLRLNRSAEKFKRQNLPLTRTDTIRFLRAYFQNPSDFRAIVGDLTQRYKRHLRFHRLGEKILNWF